MELYEKINLMVCLTTQLLEKMLSNLVLKLCGLT
jgi:hypothetical protein